MQPFSVGNDISLYLVNFERTCINAGFGKDTWSQRLLTLLPNEAADVIARMTVEEARDYDKVKLQLRQRYSLSTEALRLKFRKTRRQQGESYSEFAYKAMSFLEEWLKSASAYDDKQSVIQLIALEQFYGTLSEPMRLWIQDKPNVTTLQMTANLADEYCTRRLDSSEELQKKKKETLGTVQKVSKRLKGNKLGERVQEGRAAPNGQERGSKNFKVRRKAAVNLLKVPTARTYRRGLPAGKCVC